MRVRTLIGFCTVLLAAAACTKEKDYKTATVRDSGDVTQGGCSYLLDVSGEGEQKPQYLPSAYQHNGMKVKVIYHKSGILDTCGHTLPFIFHELVSIDDIKRDL
jgi:hypothetical protein